jgi:isopenicillin N synthase-like dioxygenase
MLMFAPSRDTLDKYSLQLSNVSAQLFKFMANNLGVDQEVFLSTFKGLPQSVRINYYPPCSQADRVLGLSPHTDGVGMTFLLHVNDVEGLQIRKDGKWFSVQAMHGALIVNIGDIIEVIWLNGYSICYRQKGCDYRVITLTCCNFGLHHINHQPFNIIYLQQILTNGRYKSVEHRAVINPNKERITIAAFHSIHLYCTIGPLQELLTADKARYKVIDGVEFTKGYFAAKLEGRRYLESLKLGL